MREVLCQKRRSIGIVYLDTLIVWALGMICICSVSDSAQLRMKFLRSSVSTELRALARI